MSLGEMQLARLQFLIRVVRKEARYLAETDKGLFPSPLTAERLRDLIKDPLEAERLDAFVSRFGRLQDTIADKLLPALLDAMAERRGAVIDNLDRAEKLRLLPSTDEWLETRQLRNQMVHEYIEDLAVLQNALNAGHRFVPTLVEVAERFASKATQLIERHAAH